MLTGAHAILYSSNADADRAFFRDVLELDSADAGGAVQLEHVAKERPVRVGVRAVDDRVRSSQHSSSS